MKLSTGLINRIILFIDISLKKEERKLFELTRKEEKKIPVEAKLHSGH